MYASTSTSSSNTNSKTSSSGSIQSSPSLSGELHIVFLVALADSQLFDIFRCLSPTALLSRIGIEISKTSQS